MRTPIHRVFISEEIIWILLDSMGIDFDSLGEIDATWRIESDPKRNTLEIKEIIKEK